MFSLLNSASPGVRFECANALVSLSSASGSIKAAAAAFIDLLCNVCENIFLFFLLVESIYINTINYSKVITMLR